MCLNASVPRTLSPAGVCPNAKPTNNTISVSFMSRPLILYLEIFNSISVRRPMDRKGRMTAYFGNSRRPDCPWNGYRYSLLTLRRRLGQRCGVNDELVTQSTIASRRLTGEIVRAHAGIIVNVYED